MDFYQSLGNLILGSRLRRISDYYLAEINRVYQQLSLEFEASWFPVFFLLSENSPLSIREISTKMEVSHSAASQLISQLKKKGLVVSEPSKVDARRQDVQLSTQGRQLLSEVLPVWSGISTAMADLESPCGETSLLDHLTLLETALEKEALSARIIHALKKPCL